MQMLRFATPADFEAILALNAESVHFLSPLTPTRLAHLHAQSALNLVAENESGAIAFLLAFREGADYDSVNYRWFAAQYESFLYIDRVVVSTHAQRTGAGRALYERVFAHARATHVPHVTCEFDIEPPNPVSLQFHSRFGFREVGQQRVAGGAKAVSLQAVQLEQTR
jgi:uncharacterized protein